LDPESREFYSQVRYIISDEEKKIFLELPQSERENFIEEFWRRRDPEPETEENEFRMDYMEKIETANKLFRGGVKEGYIQDRGRIFILLGPPDERYVSPVGRGSSVKSSEVWSYYREYRFQLRFIDHNGDGEYYLERPSSYALREINLAQLALRDPEKFKEQLFDFRIRVEQTEGEDTVFRIEIPYRKIWFTESGEKLEASFNLFIKILDDSENEVFQTQKEYNLSMTEDDLKELKGQTYPMEIPLELEAGNYTADVTLESLTEGNEFKKEHKFKIS
jgi:GWxTD domain-containing protein